MKDRRDINKIRLIYLIAVITTLFSVLFVTVVGDTYEVHTNTFFNYDVRLSNVSMSIDGDEIVRLTDYMIDDRELVFRLESLKSGIATVKINATVEYDGDDEVTGFKGDEKVDTGEETARTGDETLGTGDDTSVMEQHFVRKLQVLSTGVILDQTGILNFYGYRVVIALMIFQMIVTEVMLLWILYDHRKEGTFGYPMIAEGGIMIFNGILVLFIIYKLFNNVINSFDQYIFMVSDVGTKMLFALVPFMLVISIALIISNFRLMRHEGYRPVNTLGIVFGIIWAIYTMLTLGMSTAVWNIFSAIPGHFILFECLVYYGGYFECLFISTVVCAYLSTRFLPPKDRDYLIILGCGIRKDGSLTPLLRGRVDSAVDFAKKQETGNGHKAYFVPSGGQGSDEIISESEAMKRYLLSIGIPEERIIKEDKSTNTFQNMQFSKEVIEDREENCGGKMEDKKIGFATTNYHIFRGYVMAQKNGMKAMGISARTKRYFYPNAFLREFAGMLKDQLYNHCAFIMIITMVIICYNLI